jgi:hypothetical protein
VRTEEEEGENKKAWVCEIRYVSYKETDRTFYGSEVSQAVLLCPSGKGSFGKELVSKEGKLVQSGFFLGKQQRE